MAKLTSIYNFVPLNEQVYYPTWANDVSQDAPFSDGEDGIIDVTLCNVSPLFIRNGYADRNNQDSHSAHIKVGDKRLYYLPGSSLKGMIRSTLEIMSFGKMTQYTDRFFGWRDVGNKGFTNGISYDKEMEKVRPGWLRMEGENLFLTPCEGKFIKVTYSEISEKYQGFDTYKTGWEKNEAISKMAGEWYPLYKKDNKEYRLVCTGKMDKKKKDYLFPVECREEIPVDKETATEFFSVHEPSPKFEKIVDFLKGGHSLAVFYLPKDGNEGIKAIGISAMLRYPYKHSVAELINNQQIGLDQSKHDLAETIFGYISTGDTDSMRGRVQIGNAFSEVPLSDKELLLEVNGVQGQPKASYNPFYVKQKSSPYKTYQDADGIAGRKLYRVHKGSSVKDLPSGNDNKNTKSHFIPVPSGQTFHLRIAVHNLRKMEIGALLSAITLHKTKNVWHNIGLARGFGYGKLEIENVSLSDDFAYTVEEYLKTFEYDMSVFTYGKLPSKSMWIETRQIADLMGIHSEHDDDDLKVMSLDEYGEGKKNKNFTRLTEDGVPMKSFLSDTDREEVKQSAIEYQKELAAAGLKNKKKGWVASHKSDYDEANNFFINGQFDDAIREYTAIEDKLRIYGLDLTEEEALLKKVQSSKDELIKKQREEELAKQEQAKQQKLSAGLSAELDAQWAEDSPKAGQYKVADYNGMNNRTKQWIKKAKETTLTDSEKVAYASTFRRLFPQGCHPKKEDKDLANKDSKVWQTAKLRLEDRFDELLGDLY